MSTTEILTTAADLVEKGWTQDSYYSEGCFCADGAVQVAAGFARIERGTFILPEGNEDSRSDAEKAYELAIAAVDAEIRRSYGETYGVINFNDVRERTQNEVVDVLRRAAVLAE